MRTLETARLLLREATSADVGFVVELMNDEDYLNMIGDRGVRSIEDGREYLRTAPIYAYGADGLGFNIVERANVPVGICGLVKRPDYGAPDLGYAIMGAHSGQGYATEAALATLDYARFELGLVEVLAITTQKNRYSQRLLEKIGMARDPTRTTGGELSIYRTRW